MGKGDDILLWCVGLRKHPDKNTRKENVKPKSSTIDSSDSDDDPRSKRHKKEDRDDKVRRCVEELKEMHGHSAYTNIVYGPSY